MQEIYSLDFSRDGKYLVSGSGDKSARVWDVEKGNCVFDLKIEDFIHNEHGPIDAGITSVARKFVSSNSAEFVLISSITGWKARRCWKFGYDGPSMERFDWTTARETQGP
jgi:WD40 repeat protein